MFLVAYTCSGLAGLIYQVSWTRLLTLTLGHTTAAASTVVAAFMGGLALGAFAGGRVAKGLSPTAAIRMYAALEASVALLALLVPYELGLLTPLLAWAYRQSSVLFPLVRVVCALVVLFIPALALGATFPAAVRAFIRHPRDVGPMVGTLYAANTAGAAVGAVLAGFVLMPAFGIFATTLAGVIAGLVSAAIALIIARYTPADATVESPETVRQPSRPQKRARASRAPSTMTTLTVPAAWLAAATLGLSGFASLLCEIVWARTFAMIVGPTTYAFSATVAAVIAGLAAGSAGGAWIAKRTQRPAFWLGLTLSLTAIAISFMSSLAGDAVPRFIADELAAASRPAAALLMRQSLLVAALILLPALGFGAAFPLALDLLGTAGSMADRVARVYALNTIAAVAGSLTAGFAAIPLLGLQRSLQLAAAALVLAVLLVVLRGALSRGSRVVVATSAAVAGVMVVVNPGWDRELLASGAYKYAPRVAGTVDLETALKAGTLLFYEEDAASTVSVKELTGAISLSIDGKVDASSVGDMLTQKALGHLPLLLHDHPREICIIGLGSGVTLASALTHGVTRADVVEISAGVVRASRYFSRENHDALADLRTHLIVGDGRSHLAFTDRRYDVIISEPSNPWIAGVAALFTREFFVSARARLSPGGIICQWAHTYDMSPEDFRSIVATFTSVFPDATIWRVGEGDVLLVGSLDSIEERLVNVEQSWKRPGVADDLAQVSAFSPFSVWSLYAAGPESLAEFSRGAAIQRDDRMALEFSGPRAMFDREVGAPAWLWTLDPTRRPRVIASAFDRATAKDWRNRGAMLAATGAHVIAYQDFVTAVALDPSDATALDGLIRAAAATKREEETLAMLGTAIEKHPGVVEPYIAASKLAASSGSLERAVGFADRACAIDPVRPGPLEQLASIFADVGDAAKLAPVVARLRQVRPDGARTWYFSAVVSFLQGQLPEAAEHLRRSIEKDARSAASHNLLGALNASRGDTAAARQAFATSLSLDPHDSTTYTNLGVLELNSAQPEAAVRRFAEALSLDPYSQQALSGLAQARTQLAH